MRAKGSTSSVLSPIPNYSARATTLGGGSVGLVPFRLHREDSLISPAADNSDSPLLNSEFCGKTFASCDNCTPVRTNPTPFHFAPRHISLNYYGPIKAETLGTMPVNVYIEDSPGHVSTITDYGASMAFTITNGENGESGLVNRTLMLTGVNQVMLIPGVYHVRPKITGAARLLCDGLPAGTAATPVYWTGQSDDYVFTLVGDCNLNGVDDQLDIMDNPGDDIYTPFGLPDCCNVPLCDPDYNSDGNSDQGDVDFLTNAIAGGANPEGKDLDFNRDGNTDQGDIDALTNTVAGGGCPGEACGY